MYVSLMSIYAHAFHNFDLDIRLINRLHLLNKTEYIFNLLYWVYAQNINILAEAVNMCYIKQQMSESL